MPGKSNLKYLLVFFFIPLFPGCSNSHSRRPDTLDLPKDSIISRERMIDLLVDMHLLEGALTGEKNKGIRTEGVDAVYYNGLFRKYRITGNRLKKNLEYYRQDPEDFIKLYEEVIKRLEDYSLPGKKTVKPLRKN